MAASGPGPSNTYPPFTLPPLAKITKETWARIMEGEAERKAAQLASDRAVALRKAMQGSATALSPAPAADLFSVQHVQRAVEDVKDGLSHNARASSRSRSPCLSQAGGHDHDEPPNCAVWTISSSPRWMLAAADAGSSFQVIVDCTALREHSTKPLSVHTGFHPDILHSILHHGGFQEVLRQVKEFVSCDSELQGGIIRCFCTSGRHRSVGAALLVAKALRPSGCKIRLVHEGLKATPHQHDRTTCEDCTGDLSAADTQFLQALWGSCL